MQHVSFWDRDLPAYFDDVAAEVHLLRQGVGLLDLSFFDLVAISGPDAGTFLQGLVSQDVRTVKPGNAARSWLLDASGKILFPLTIHNFADRGLVLETGPGMGQDLIAHLDRYLIMEDARLEVLTDHGLVSLQGPKAVSPEGLAAVANDRCGHGGYDLLVTRDQVPALLADGLGQGVAQVGWEAFNLVRMQAFLPWFGVDMETGVNALIYGHDQRVSHTKGCFIGQETVAKTRDRGRPPQLLVLLRLEDQGTAARGDQLTADDKPVGQLTSVARDDRGIWAFALLKYKSAQADQISDAQGRTWHVQQRAVFKVG